MSRPDRRRRFRDRAKILSSPPEPLISRNSLISKQIYFRKSCHVYPMPSAIIEVGDKKLALPPALEISPKLSPLEEIFYKGISFSTPINS